MNNTNDVKKEIPKRLNPYMVTEILANTYEKLTGVKLINEYSTGEYYTLPQEELETTTQLLKMSMKKFITEMENNEKLDMDLLDSLVKFLQGMKKRAIKFTA